MRVTWEMKYGELRAKLKEKYRKKMKKIKYQEKGIPTTEKPSVKNSCLARKVVSVEHHFMVEKIRESRDYSFLFSDDPFEPNPRPSSNATSRKTSYNVVVGPDELQETKKPLSSFKIKVKYNKIAPKDFKNQKRYVNEKEKNMGSIKNKISRGELQDSRKPYLENLERKKPNLEPKEQKLQPLKRLRRNRSDDESDEEEAEKAFRMIRQMYNTKRFVGRDDLDRDMETNYGDLLKEEKKSAKIARAEDREQLRLIMEEERREKSKKRKIGN